jgi:hypothetical protein
MGVQPAIIHTSGTLMHTPNKNLVITFNVGLIITTGILIDIQTRISQSLPILCQEPRSGQ